MIIDRSQVGMTGWTVQCPLSQLNRDALRYQWSLLSALTISTPEQQVAHYYLEACPNESLDFDEAERVQTERDGPLSKEFKRNLPQSTGNCYLMPSGRLVNAEDVLHNQTVIAATPSEAFSDHPAEATAGVPTRLD